MTRQDRFHGRETSRADSGCDWPSCTESGEFKAPKRESGLNQPYWFCLDHVRTYNASWNYLDGLSDQEIGRMEFSALGWNRPTWSVRNGQRGTDFAFADPLDVLKGAGFRDGGIGARQSGRSRHKPVAAADREALAVLGLGATANAEDIRKEYKRLVKQLHPDANASSRAGEKRLQAVIEAYTHLSHAFAG